MFSSQDDRVITLDTAYDRIGHGRIQRILVFVNSIVRNSGCFFNYCFAYLILEQSYVCSPLGGEQSTFAECSVETICAARESDEPLSFTYKVDTSYEFYLNNWYVEMDLMCTPVTKVSLMFTMLFVGTIASGFLAVIPDRIGRRKSVIGGMAVSLASQIVMLFMPSLVARSICFFVLGFSNLKNSQSYVWASECVPF